MNEKEIIDGLEKALEPMSKAHQDFLKQTMDIIKDAFEIGLEVGKKLK